MIFEDKKVLVFGFGILGGGLATTNWLLRQGARVTVTDLKTQEQLSDSLGKIEGHVELRLGGHSMRDIEENDIIVINPDVSIRNEFIQYAFKLGKEVANEATIFFQEFKKSLGGTRDKPIIAVTGTRGKTTITTWVEHFLKPKFKSSIAGNSLTHPFLKVLDRAGGLEMAVAEISSFHLELFDRTPISGPAIAVITNIFQDHLNRHQTIEEYARIKANIFKYQTSDNNLILNYDNKWTQFLLTQKPLAKVWYFSGQILPVGLNGVWSSDKTVYFRKAGLKEKALMLSDSVLMRGEHNISNLLAAALLAHLAGCSWADIQFRINSLPEIPFRQEIILKTDTLTVVNDTAATSPEGAIQALKRFGGLETVLITGGTDRDLDFVELGKIIPQFIQSSNLVFLAGSATEKIRLALGDFAASCPIYDSLQECVEVAFKKALQQSSGQTGQYPQSVILFSPASKSFEKFENEYDRGEQFNNLIKKHLESNSGSGL